MKTSKKIQTFLELLPRDSLEKEWPKYSAREIAICLLHSDLVDQARWLSFLPEAKSVRVKEEIIYLNRIQVRYSLYAKVVNTFIERFGKAGVDYRLPSYIRAVR